MIICVYCICGYLIVDFDLLGMCDEILYLELDLCIYGFSDVDMNCLIFIDNVLGFEVVMMNEILVIVKCIYCGIFVL